MTIAQLECCLPWLEIDTAELTHLSSLGFVLLILVGGIVVMQTYGEPIRHTKLRSYGLIVILTNFLLYLARNERKIQG